MSRIQDCEIEEQRIVQKCLDLCDTIQDVFYYRDPDDFGITPELAKHWKGLYRTAKKILESYYNVGEVPYLVWEPESEDGRFRPKKKEVEP